MLRRHFVEFVVLEQAVVVQAHRLAHHADEIVVHHAPRLEARDLRRVRRAPANKRVQGLGRHVLHRRVLRVVAQRRGDQRQQRHLFWIEHDVRPHLAAEGRVVPRVFQRLRLARLRLRLRLRRLGFHRLRQRCSQRDLLRPRVEQRRERLCDLALAQQALLFALFLVAFFLFAPGRRQRCGAASAGGRSFAAAYCKPRSVCRRRHRLALLSRDGPRGGGGAACTRLRVAVQPVPGRPVRREDLRRL